VRVSEKGVGGLPELKVIKLIRYGTKMISDLADRGLADIGCELISARG
jgi:hypothetical protein